MNQTVQNTSTKRLDPMDKTIGARLRSCRIVKGFTQEKLAENLGITFQQVQKYERGTNRISVSRLVHIAEALNTPIEYFIKGADKPGFAEQGQESYNHNDNQATTPAETPQKSVFDRRETLNLLKVYYSIEDEKQRKDLMKVIRTFVGNAQKS